MNEFTLGYISGFAQTIIGHPLDTIKTNFQAKKSIYPITIRNLYRGVIPPLLGNSCVVSLHFGLNDTLNPYLWNNNFISGFFAGLGGSIILNPMELYKVRAQNRITPIYINPLYGLLPTMGRETFGISVYFGTYHYLFDNGICNSLLAGGISGWMSWLISYPLDVIKTRIQSNRANTIIEAYHQKHLWKGFGICSVRSVIVNGLGFYIYQHIKDLEKNM